MQCKYCNKDCKNSNSLRNHERLCPSNPDRQKSNFEGNNFKHLNAFSKAKLTGKSIPESPCKGREGTFLGKQHSKETKEKMSKTKKQMYLQGWEVKAGRCKKIHYDSPIAGNISLDGSWELAVAIYLDSQKVNWKRNTQRFPYINKEGKEATYCPDFYIEDWDSYLEVKGYETDLDRLKWSQFPHGLIIWKRQQLKEHGIEFLSSGSARI